MKAFIFVLPLIFITEFCLAQCIDKNFVIYHRSPNKKYELVAIPYSDACETEVQIYVYERKSGKILYGFNQSNISDNLFVLTDDGQMVYQFYANLNGKITDPSYKTFITYRKGIEVDTVQVQHVSVDFSYLIKRKYPDRKRRIKYKSNDHNYRAEINGDTLCIKAFKNYFIYFSLPSYQFIKAVLGDDKNLVRNLNYKKLQYKVLYKDVYWRERMLDKLKDKYLDTYY